MTKQDKQGDFDRLLDNVIHVATHVEYARADIATAELQALLDAAVAHFTAARDLCLAGRAIDFHDRLTRTWGIVRRSAAARGLSVPRIW